MISRATMYRSLASAAKSLAPRKAKSFMIAVCEYMADKKEPSFQDSGLRAIWIVAKDMIDKASQGACHTPSDTPYNTPCQAPCHTPTEGATDTPTEGATDTPTEGATDTPTEGGEK